MTHLEQSASPPRGGADSRPAPEAGGLSAASRVADPRSRAVVTELDRIERRWSQLPLGRAEAAMPTLRQVLDALTERAGRCPVPDLGPGTALHQLKVLVWEAYCETPPPGIPDPHGIPDLVTDLTTLRRALP